MSQMLPAITGKALGKKGLGYGKLVSDWTRIVGPELGSATAPAKLAFPRGQRNEATLTVEVIPARALELQHMIPQLLERINAVFGYNAVARIALIQRPQERPVRMSNLRPLSPREERDLMAVTGTVPDGDLRAALESLGRAVAGSVK